MSVADLVSEAIDDDVLRGVLGARGIRYSAMGPRSAGTALNFLWDSASGGGAAGRTVFARGGPDALTQALLAAARSYGATLRCSVDVSAIRTKGGSVQGVALADGEEIDARIVASSADPKQTLLRLLDPAEIGPTLSWRAENIRMPGVVAKVTLVLDRPAGVRRRRRRAPEGTNRHRSEPRRPRAGIQRLEVRPDLRAPVSRGDDPDPLRSCARP